MTEAKKEKKSKSGSKTIIKVLIGLIFIVVGIWAIINFWEALVTVFLGCMGLFLVMAGAVTIAIAKE